MTNLQHFLLAAIWLFLLPATTQSQDTFSIVAVDPETGAVGGAGASCIDDFDCNGCGGVIIINGLIPGRGAMNSQAYACIPNVNLNLGLAQLEQGSSPQEALDYVLANDQCVFQTASWRQYGIVDFDPDGAPRSVAYTGADCSPYANHITGPTYAIQGNILLGQEILDSMEARFLNTNGTLAEKLMAALQGANVPGADTRCLLEGVSSKSAFIRVAMPDDEPGNYFLELNVRSTPYGEEPIDSLQNLFDEWLLTDTKTPVDARSAVTVYPNPSAGSVIFEVVDSEKGTDSKVQVFDIMGTLITEGTMRGGQFILGSGVLPASGTYHYSVLNAEGQKFSVGTFVYQK